LQLLPQSMLGPKKAKKNNKKRKGKGRIWTIRDFQHIT